MRATIKVTCKEVQPSVFLATSTSMECSIDMMGLKAEASYLAAVHYARVEVNDKLEIKKKTEELIAKVVAGATVPVSRQVRRQQKLQKQIESLAGKEDLTMREAYKLSKLMEKSIENADTLKPEHKYERRAERNRWNVKTDSLADKKDSLYWVAVRSVPLKPEEVQSYIHKEKLTVSKDSLQIVCANTSSAGVNIMHAFWVGDTFRTKN